MGLLHEAVNSNWRATEAPMWIGDRNKLQGRDMICIGLKTVPYSLLDGMCIYCTL